MPYYKVDKVFKYTETVYIEAENPEQAKDNAGAVEGEHNNDDTWYDAIALEITEREYNSEAG